MKNFIINALIGLLFISTVAPADGNYKAVDGHYKEITKLVDKFTDKVIYAGENIHVGNLTTAMSRYENQRYYFSIWDKNEANCTDENSTINFLFTDGTKLTANNSAKHQCEHSAIIPYLDETKRALFRDKLLEAVRMNHTKGSTEAEFTKQIAKKLQTQFVEMHEIWEDICKLDLQKCTKYEVLDDWNKNKEKMKKLGIFGNWLSKLM